MNKPITGIDFSGAGDFYPKVNDETTMKLGEVGWPNPAIDKANQPQRTWVELTTDDWDEIRKQVKYNFEMTTGEYAERVSHLVEDKLREKNT